jgi:hypothetical protein
MAKQFIRKFEASTYGHHARGIPRHLLHGDPHRLV